MSAPDSHPPLEDVLDAYAVEQDTGSGTLKKYIRSYPEYAGDLVDLSRELSKFIVENDEPLSTKDAVRIDEAWERHVAEAPMPVTDLLATLSVAELRSVAERLGVPRQVLAAFRERRVEIASVPQLFLKRFAAVLNSSVERLIASFTLASSPALARSYKANTKPVVHALATFEQLLIDAGLSNEQRAALMANDE